MNFTLLLRIGMGLAIVFLINKELHSLALTVFCLFTVLGMEISGRIFKMLLISIKDIEKRLSLLEEKMEN